MPPPLALPDRPLDTWASSQVSFPTLSGSLWKPPTCQPHVHFSRWGGAAVRCSVCGPCALGGNKAEEQVWVGVRDDEPVLGPSCGAGAVGAPTCSANYMARLLGKAERSPAGTGGASGTWRLTIVPTGASGPGKWKWFSRTREWEAPARSPHTAPRAWRSATRAGPARDLPGGGGMRARSGAAPSGRPPRSARRREARELRCAEREARQWRPRAVARPAGATPPSVGAGRPATGWEGPGPAPPRPAPPLTHAPAEPRGRAARLPRGGALLSPAPEVSSEASFRRESPAFPGFEGGAVVVPRARISEV